MGIQLPAELADVATATGVRWPQADETAMTESAAAWRAAATELSTLGADADAAAHSAFNAFDGGAAEAARRHWNGYVAHDGRLPAMVRACNEAADRLEHGAEQVGAAKVEIIRQLVALKRQRDAAQQAQAAGYPAATAGMGALLAGTSNSVAQVYGQLTETVRTAPGTIVEAPPGGQGSPAGHTGPGGSSGDTGQPGNPPSIFDRALGVATETVEDGSGRLDRIAATATGVITDTGGAPVHQPQSTTVSGYVPDAGSGSTGPVPLLDRGSTTAPGYVPPFAVTGEPDGAAPQPVAGSVTEPIDPVAGVPGGPATVLPSLATPVDVQAATGAPRPDQVLPANPPTSGSGALPGSGAVPGGSGGAGNVVGRPPVSAGGLLVGPGVPGGGGSGTGGPGAGGSSTGGPGAGGAGTGGFGGGAAGRLAGPVAGVPIVPGGSGGPGVPAPGGGSVAPAPGGGSGSSGVPGSRPAGPVPGVQFDQAARSGAALRPLPGIDPGMADPRAAAIRAPGLPAPGGQQMPGLGGAVAGGAVAGGGHPPGTTAHPPGAPAGTGQSPGAPGGTGQSPGGTGGSGQPASQSAQPTGTDADQTRTVADRRSRSGLMPGLLADPADLAAQGRPPRGDRADQGGALELFMMFLFPPGEEPVPARRPAVQVPPPPPELDLAAGLRFPPGDHPQADLVLSAADHGAGREPVVPLPGLAGDSPAVQALSAGHDPLGGQHERDWARRFLVREAMAGPAEYPVHAEYAWPPAEAYPEGACAPETAEPVVLEPGTLIDRFGDPTGLVLAAAGTPFGQRSLPPEYRWLGYHCYEVTQPLPVWRAVSAAWFGQPGGGLRYRTTHPVLDLLALGYLVDVTHGTDPGSAS